MEKAICLVKSCGKEPSSRGLCPACLATAHKMITRGEATETLLIQLGMMLPKKVRQMGKFKTDFMERVRKEM